METGLAGATVVVTGGSSNAGRATVLAFAREGAKVVIASRDAEAGERVAAKALEDGAEDAVWVGTDVVDADQAENLARATIDRFGRVDVLVNNVGGGGVVDFKPFWETTPEDWKLDVDLTLTSVLNCSRAFLPRMIEQGPGARIVNIGSTSGITGDPGLAVYSAAKGAVHTFTRILAREVGEHGITVNAVAPWGIMPDDPENDTSPGSRWSPGVGKFALIGLMDPERRADWKSKTVLGDALDRPMLLPSELAGAVVYLASDAARFTTGQVLVIDGGLTVNVP
jgi:NAD(P)-dependent dehydrogenase (short-subunit alcohol dehydrogenase family)